MGTDTRYVPIAKLIRTTGDAAYNTLYGVNREIQHFASDESNRYWYSLHGNNQVPELNIITRYARDGIGIDRNQIDVSLPTTLFGHQGLAVENLPNNAVKIWCTDGTNPLAAMRFDYVPGSGPVNTQSYVLFKTADGFNADISGFDGFSVNNEYVIGHAKVVGVDTVVCRLWYLQDLIDGGPGDYTTSYRYSFNLLDLYDSQHPIQGISCDGKYVYGISGGNGFVTPPPRMFKYDLQTGAVLERNMNVQIGAAEADLDGSGVSWEPEGSQFINVNGVHQLCVGFRSGSSLTPSVYRVYAINPKRILDVALAGSGNLAYFRRLEQIIGQFFVNTAGFAIQAVGSAVNLRLGTNGINDWEIEATARGWRPLDHDLQRIGQLTRRVLAITTRMIEFSAGVTITSGTGSPEGVVTADPGAVYIRINPADITTTLYSKVTGVGNVGWGNHA
jgi:hypothetical protein